MANRITPEDRFWPKVDRSGDCWLWTGGTTNGGYGMFWFEGQMRVAHRWLYERINGAVPKELDLDHLCRTRACVNPSHLEPVTRSENLRRGEVPQLYNKPTKCKQGHEFTPENTINRAGGGRHCKTCTRASQARYRERMHG